MMAEKDSLALLEMCGLVALKKDELGSIVGVRAVKELAIHAFIDEFVLSDVMAILITKAPKDKKPRYFVCIGGNKNRVSVTVQGNMSGRRAPRVCRPTLREDLMRIFVACNCVTAPSIKRNSSDFRFRKNVQEAGMSESDIYELKAKIESLEKAVVIADETIEHLKSKSAELEMELDMVKSENKRYRMLIEESQHDQRESIFQTKQYPVLSVTKINEEYIRSQADINHLMAEMRKLDNDETHPDLTPFAFDPGNYSKVSYVPIPTASNQKSFKVALNKITLFKFHKCNS